MKRAAFLLVFLASRAASGAEPVRDLKVDVQSGPPATLRVRGAADLPDRLLLTLAIRHERSDFRGAESKLLDQFRVPVRGGAFDRTFSLPRLPFGKYVLEVGCDRTHQREDVALPPGEIRGEASFKVDFTEDIAGPAKTYQALLPTLEDLWRELEAAYRPLASRLKDPKAIAEWTRFQGGWDPRMDKAAVTLEPCEDLLYQELRLGLNLASNRLRLFREDYESLILTGDHCAKYHAHHKPGDDWFNQDPGADLAEDRVRLAQEFAFNTGKKIVDYGYDKATGLMGGPKWEGFRTRFGQDLDRIETACSDLSLGACRAEMKAIAPDVPTLIQAGRAFLAAGDQMAADPAKGQAALAAAKEPLKKAYQSVRNRILASEARRLGKETP